MIAAYGQTANFLIEAGVIGAGGVVLGGIGGLLGAAFGPVILRALQAVLFLEGEILGEEAYPSFETAVTVTGAGGALAALMLWAAESWGIIA